MVQIIQTEKQKERAKLPTRLEVLREYYNRNALDRQYIDELKRLEAGDQGEKLVLDYLNEYGEPYWKVMKNIWLNHHSLFECDLLLITKYVWYPMEIKHYTGQYKLENSQWSCYGNKIPNNPVSQSQKVFIHFLNLAHEHQLPVTIKGRIVFTGEHFDLDVRDSIEDLEIVKMNQLRDFIREISWEERKSNGREIDVDMVKEFIQQYETENPFPAECLYDEMGSRMRKGVKCSYCGSFDVDLKSSFVTCTCGMHEPSEMAIVRTICEYGVIHFNKDLIMSEVVDFFDGDYSESTIRRHLNKYFERYGRGRGTRYCNLKKQFYLIHETFSFKRKGYFEFPVGMNSREYIN